MAYRLAGRFGYDRQFPFRVTVHPDKMHAPTHWLKPRRIFVNSMGDLFHEQVHDETIFEVFDEASHNRRHTYLFLTKRPERMRDWFEKYSKRFWQYHAPGEPEKAAPWPDPQFWLGVTAENQKMADKRIPILLDIPAAVRFVSVEPMLEPIDLRYSTFNGADSLDSLEGIHWVICGAETGPGKRPFSNDWAVKLWAQCQRAGVPYFFKKDAIGCTAFLPPGMKHHGQWRELPGQKHTCEVCNEHK
jgi:protein gp37